MIDLSSLKPYIVDDIDYYVKVATKTITNTSFDIWFCVELDNFLDCSRRLSDGKRLFQTNFYSYSVELSVTLAMINLYGGDDKDLYYEQLLKRHNANLEFEAINGMEYDFTKISKRKSSTKKSKQTSVFEQNQSKETAAERKLKAHIAKISSLNIKIKPVRNDNTV